MKPKSVNCLFPKCAKPVVRRGLCDTHYSTAAQMIHRKKTTWEKLIREGKATAELGKRGRPAKVTNWFANVKTK